jgi:hypothetical protein
MINQEERLKQLRDAIKEALAADKTVFETWKGILDRFQRGQVIQTKTVVFVDECGHQVTSHDDIIYAFLCGLNGHMREAERHAYEFAFVKLRSVYTTIDDRDKLSMQRAMLDGVMYYDFDVSREIGHFVDFQDLAEYDIDDDYLIYQMLDGEFTSCMYQEADTYKDADERMKFIMQWRNAPYQGH